MEEQKDALGMLDLMIRPAFCVKENKIVKVNQAAEGLFLTPGAAIQPLLLTGGSEYAAFTDGCLYLTLSLSGQSCGASITRVDGMDVFVLEQEEDHAELRSMALAARELRDPLTNVMILADQLYPLSALQDDPATKELALRLNRGLYQMLRVIGNMSDASRCAVTSRQETREIGSLFDEVFEKAEALICHTGVTLTYKGLNEQVYALADAEQLERAVLNILSNAIKFTPKNGTIEAKLTRHGSMLRLSVQDGGSGIAENIRSSVFNRYLRQPAIEDSRFGIGLGMVLIRSAAANHGGAVLIDQPSGKGTRITMTFAIRQSRDTMLRSNVLRVDYAGEQDHGLIELSECLPVKLYEKGIRD